MEKIIKVFCLEEHEWKRLEAVRTRLYSELQLNVDSMRDLVRKYTG